MLSGPHLHNSKVIPRGRLRASKRVSLYCFMLLDTAYGFKFHCPDAVLRSLSMSGVAAAMRKNTLGH